MKRRSEALAPGTLFGLLEVVREREEYENGRRIVECLCACDPTRTVIVLVRKIQLKTQRSCGCASGIYRRRSQALAPGTLFGLLEVVREREDLEVPVGSLAKRQHGRRIVECLCACDPTRTKIILVEKVHLKNSQRSCGCAPRARRSQTLVPGTVFGRLEVVRELDHVLRGRPLVECLCACDASRTQIVLVPRNHLLNQNTRSCGCLVRAVQQERIDRSITSGRCDPDGNRSPEYHTWASMIARCEQTEHKGWARYGGRGIRVCERWRQSFEAFLEDMGPRPADKDSIDRFPDNDGNYEPGNCRWATDEEQAQNKSNSRYVTVGEEAVTMGKLARLHGMTTAAVWHRMVKNGETAEEAVSRPTRQRTAIVVEGETMTVSEWAKRHNMKVTTVFQRIYKGQTPEQAVRPVGR